LKQTPLAEILPWPPRPALPRSACSVLPPPLSSLYQAVASLREATPNKGGHRERAMDLIQQAIDQVQQGIEFADRRD
jgi:hypothetical protein